ncbi:hypothetical protein V2J09_004314 [Rumex salicifolius]
MSLFKAPRPPMVAVETADVNIYLDLELERYNSLLALSKVVPEKQEKSIKGRPYLADQDDLKNTDQNKLAQPHPSPLHLLLQLSPAAALSQATTSGYRTTCFYDRRRYSSSPPLSTPGLQKLKNSMGDFAIKSAPLPSSDSGSLSQAAIQKETLISQSRPSSSTVNKSSRVLRVLSSQGLDCLVQLALKYQPDRNTNNPAAKRKFQEIRDAYEEQPQTVSCLHHQHVPEKPTVL